MTEPKTKARVFADAPLNQSARLAFAPGQGHYLANVMRCQPQDRVAVFNGRDGEWSVLLQSVSRARVAGTVEHRTREQIDEPGPWLAFAPIKKTQTQFLAQKATELGVETFLPVITARTEASGFNPERFRANVIEAAEQSRRLTVPKVLSPCPLENIAAQLPPDCHLFILDAAGGGMPLGQALANPGAQPHAFLIGPEGGFAPAELQFSRNLAYATCVSLGSRILRAETAAMAVLACWQAYVGDWRK